MVGCLLVPFFVVIALILFASSFVEDPMLTVVVLFVSVARIGLGKP